MLDVEQQRLSQRIAQYVDRRKLNSHTIGNNRQYEIHVLVTRYDKGNAFARAMLAGLGQIHIDADVSELILPQRTQAAAFHIAKTFAWGGLYGMSTSMEDVEQGFAEGVAEAVTDEQAGTAPEAKKEGRAASP